jgi:ZIP family zinc transporter
MPESVSSTTGWITVILLSLLSCVTASLGVAAALALRGHRNAIALGIGFSAGMMIVIAAVELLPHSMAQAGPVATLASAAIGAGLIVAAHQFVPHIHLFEEKGPPGGTAVRSAYLVLLGLMLHDLAEGVALASAYVASTSLGVLVALAVALHNLPEQFAMAVPAAAVERKQALFTAALVAAMAEPVGAALGLIATEWLPGRNPQLMAFAAGAMLFVSVHELVPLARRYGRLRLFLAGGAASLLVYGALARLTTGRVWFAS